MMGGGNPALIVAEVGMAHDGSLSLAHAFIDVIARAGADAVKFQTHLAAAESTPQEPFRVVFSRQDESRQGYWRRTEFTPRQWQGLAEHARERGLLFMSSPFSEAAVDLLEEVGVAAYKVASGEVTNTALLERLLAAGKPLLLSSGMSGLAEIDAMAQLVRGAGVPFGLLQSTSLYPCPPEKIGLNLLPVFRQRYECPVGLSDHSGRIHAGLAATALGCDILEVHVTLTRDMPGPDVAASLTPEEFRRLIEGVRDIEAMLANPVDKDHAAGELGPLRGLFYHSIVAAVDLPAGTVLQRHHLAAKKPGTGLPIDRLPELVGRVLKRAVQADEFLKEEDFR
jgi:N-acetylneuraminate synthase